MPDDVLQIDTARTDRIRDRLQNLAGRSAEAADRLTRALLQAAVDQALELAAGTGAVPSSVTALEAERAYLVCLHADRMLSQREVEVLFRTTPGRARSILTTMGATYAEALAQKFEARIAEDVTVKRSGTDKAGLTYTLTFSEPAVFQLAVAAIRNRGLSDAIDEEAAQRRQVVLRRTVERDGKPVDVLERLGWAGGQP